MKIFCYLIFILSCISLDVKSQNETDSLYALKVDSIIHSRYNQNYHKASDFKQIQLFDSTTNKTIIGRYKNGQLDEIYYFTEFEICKESVTFYYLNGHLICMEYQLSDPDERSDMPPSMTFKFYYRNEKIIFTTKELYHHEPITCDKEKWQTKDFLKECDYYLQLLNKK